ncbi:MAG: TolC family protein [Sulfurimonas sp.]|nr:TolC family protein [Sulfurimonas sp.]
MNRKLLLLIIPALMYGDNLKSLLEFATSNNKIVASNVLIQEAKKSEVESSQSAYYPTVDVGGFYQRSDDASPFAPGTIYSGYAKVGVDLYDGGRKSNTIKQNQAIVDSSKYSSLAYKKSLQLQIVQDFYNIKSAKSTLDALKESNNQISAELDRVKKFYEAGTVTKDDVERLRAAYSNNIYRISSVKYRIKSLKKILGIKVGKKIETLDASSIEISENLQKELSDDILALQANSSSLTYSANNISSAYYPQIRVEDTYNLYGYQDKPSMGGQEIKQLDNQNKLMLTLNIRLFDMGTISKQKESLLLQKEALQKQIEQYQDQQDVNVELALLKIDTTKAQIQSAKSALESSTIAYETVSKKYSAGVVDYVTYLDSLSVKTNAKAQYEKALNDLQIAYASYYYYTNKNIKDFIK